MQRWQGDLLCCKLQQTRRRVCEQRFHRSAAATLDVPQEQKVEDKKITLLLTDPQSQVFGDEEERVTRACGHFRLK